MGFTFIHRRCFIISREVRDMIIHARGGKSGKRRHRGGARPHRGGARHAHDHALRYCTSSQQHRDGRALRYGTSSQQHRDGRDGLQASASSVSGQATTTTSAATSSVRRSDLLPRRRSSNRGRDHRAPALEIGGGRSTSIGRQAMRRRWCREVHADRRTVL